MSHCWVSSVNRCTLLIVACSYDRGEVWWILMAGCWFIKFSLPTFLSPYFLWKLLSNSSKLYLSKFRECFICQISSDSVVKVLCYTVLGACVIIIVYTVGLSCIANSVLVEKYHDITFYWVFINACKMIVLLECFYFCNNFSFASTIFLIPVVAMTKFIQFCYKQFARYGKNCSNSDISSIISLKSRQFRYYFISVLQYYWDTVQPGNAQC